MAECVVRHLRVAAASEPAARRFVSTLEDALRCATLPGGDRRVVAVRRLALGRVRHDAGTQGLGRLIEERLARGDIAWADADLPPDPRADIVGFADALEARVHLARRLAAGASCDAWYWPQVVPEYRRDLAPREALRRVAQAIAAVPEARVALPAWVARLVRAGGAGALLAAIDESRGQSLLRAAGIAIPPTPLRGDAADRPDAVAPASTAQPTTNARPGAAPSPADPGLAAVPAAPIAWPLWLRVVLARAGVATRGLRAASVPASAAHGTVDTPVEMHTPRDVAAPGKAVPEALATRVVDSPRSASPTPALTAPPPVQREAPRDVATPATAFDGDWHPTDCGGLLVLLPVLARCGLVARDDADASRAAALHVLHLALCRMRAQPHDPAWHLVAELAAMPPAAARDAHARARHELATARRWLHRHARLGLVTLVRRRARLALTATHIDMRFALAGADVRVRRLGLDADPGWLPWFGRVIAFQFAGRLP